MSKVDESSMKAETSPTRSSSVTGALGMPCALLSLASGVVSLAVAVLLWWGPFFPPLIKRIGEQAGVFSAVLGLVLAGIGMASQRKRVRRVALIAVVVNLAILSFTIDTIFMLMR
jgi:hypothetical protein